MDTLGYVLDYSKEKELGMLSIDVDGNDYWFLEKLIVTNSSIIIVDLNVSFGLRPISVHYDPTFDREKKYESLGYYGASISVSHYPCDIHNYSLMDISKNGVNAFFVKNNLLGHDD